VADTVGDKKIRFLHFHFKSEARRLVNFDEHGKDKSRYGSIFHTLFEMPDLRRRCLALCIMLRLM